MSRAGDGKRQAAGSTSRRPINVHVSLAHDSEDEAATRAQLKALLERYDLRPFEFTDQVVIDASAIPHSHPVLTLHTADTDDLLLLANYLHEQLHWFLTQQPDEYVEPAYQAVVAHYPNPPVGFPVGAQDVFSSHLHYLVCRLEYLVLCHVIGEQEARRAISFWQRHHYTEIYRSIMEDGEALDDILRAHSLLPGPLIPGNC